MKSIKIFLFLGLLLLPSIAWSARNDSLIVYRSTVISGSNTNWTKLNSTGTTVLIDYQVLSTGTLASEVMNIFDTAVTTDAAIQSWMNFPVNSYISYPLGIETTTGTHINILSSPFTKVRLRFYRIIQ